jgi:hypothetical protein
MGWLGLEFIVAVERWVLEFGVFDAFPRAIEHDLVAVGLWMEVRTVDCEFGASHKRDSLRPALGCDVVGLISVPSSIKFILS